MNSKHCAGTSRAKSLVGTSDGSLSRFSPATITVARIIKFNGFVGLPPIFTACNGRQLWPTSEGCQDVRCPLCAACCPCLSTPHPTNVRCPLLGPNTTSRLACRVARPVPPRSCCVRTRAPDIGLPVPVPAGVPSLRAARCPSSLGERLRSPSAHHLCTLAHPPRPRPTHIADIVFVCACVDRT